MNQPRFNHAIAVLISVVVLSGSAMHTATTWAQSKTVFGETGFGQDCYSRAELAINFNAADRSDVEICSKALEDINLSRSDRAATLVNRGILQLAYGDVEAARASYDLALSLADDQGETHINIANLYVRQKRYREAVAEYSKGIDMMKRRQHVAFINRGLAYEYLEEFEAARQDYERAIEMAPSWVRAKKMLARVKIKLADRS